MYSVDLHLFTLAVKDQAILTDQIHFLIEGSQRLFHIRSFISFQVHYVIAFLQNLLNFQDVSSSKGLPSTRTKTFSHSYDDIFHCT